MAPFFPYQSSPERAISGAWSSPPSPQSRIRNSGGLKLWDDSASDDFASSFSDFAVSTKGSTTQNTNLRGKTEEKGGEQDEDILFFGSGSPNLSTVIITLILITIILLNFSAILDTLLILLLFAPYPPVFRYARLMVMIILVMHGSVTVMAKMECILICSGASISGIIDWCHVRSRVMLRQFDAERGEYQGGEYDADDEADHLVLETEKHDSWTDSD